MSLERPVSSIEPEAPPPPRAIRWYHKISSFVFIVFCLEVGIFLVMFPWTEYWEQNYFSSLLPEWRHLWTNSYVRGAISGIGVINVYISIAEMFRLRRFLR